MSIRARIIAGYVILVFISFSLIIYLTLGDVRPRYLEAVEESMVDTAQLTAALIAEQSTSDEINFDTLADALKRISTREFAAHIYDYTKTSTTVRVYVTDAAGTLLYDSENLDPPGTDYSQWNDVYNTLRGKYGARSTRKVPDQASSSTLYVAAPIIKEGRIIGVVSVGKLKDNVSVFIEIAKRRFMQAAIFIALTSLILGILLSDWITRPIKALIEYVKAVKDGKQSQLPVLDSGELALLGDALEEMRIKLEGKEYIENYIQTLTHEIKSPLTAIKGAAELLTEEIPEAKRQLFLKNIRLEVDRLHDFVDRLLQLSSLERRTTIEDSENINLQELMEALTISFKAQLQQKKLTMTLSIEQSPPVPGEPFLLRQAFSNLLQNAIDFSEEGSKIEIFIYPISDGKTAVRIRDFGTGIPGYAMERVFERFYSLERPDTGKKSSGLGLPFVKEVIALHGGRITMNNVDPGLEAEVTFG